MGAKDHRQHNVPDKQENKRLRKKGNKNNDVQATSSSASVYADEKGKDVYQPGDDQSTHSESWQMVYGNEGLTNFLVSGETPVYTYYEEYPNFLNMDISSDVGEPSSTYNINSENDSTNLSAGPNIYNQNYQIGLTSRLVANAQDQKNEQEEEDEKNVIEFVNSLLYDPTVGQEVNVIAGSIPGLVPGKHKFVRLEGLCKDTRKRCSECSDKHKETKYKFCPRDKVKRVNTMCTKCSRFFCKNCFKEVHQLESVPSITTTEQPKTDQKCSFCNINLGQDEDSLIKHSKECLKIPREHEKWFGCYHCGHNFPTSYALTVHFRQHTGYKPFKCHFCSHATVDFHSLNRHIRGHTGERPYKCHLCDTYAGKDKTCLNSHLKRIHKVERAPKK